jgi:hypothetical protein
MHEISKVRDLFSNNKIKIKLYFKHFKERISFTFIIEKSSDILVIC